ncbi:MAG: hypothetical protein ACXIVD_12975 [Salinarimonas sp.]
MQNQIYALKVIALGDIVLMLVLAIVAICIALVFFLIFFASKRIRFVSFYVLIACATFGLLGSIVGFIMAMSREPSVDAIIPALLTIAGGLMVYVMTGKGMATRLLILCALSSFSLNILVGTLSGSRLRTTIEMHERFEVAEQNERIRQYIEALKLQFEENMRQRQQASEGD